MPTAIRQVELSQPVTDVHGLHRYDRCMLILRWRGRVVGRVTAPVQDDRLAAARVRQLASEGLGVDAVTAWAEDVIGYDERDSHAGRRPTSTVAICTHERPDDLARALEAVCALTPWPADILVVDNAPCTSRTREVAGRFGRVRYVVEPRQGLNVARNRAVREALGEVIAFTDDDAMPEAGWLDALLDNFRDPRVLCVTGLTLPLELETAAQELFEEHATFARGFRRRTFNGRMDNPLAVAAIGAGVNMAVRRSLPHRVGRFDERLDGGTPTRSGGDHEMFARILLNGGRIVYEPGAVVWHRHRRTLPEVVATVRGYGTGVYATWTGLLVERRELALLRLAWQWFRYDHLPLFTRPRRLRRREGRDALRWAELRGCVEGPRAWFLSRRRGVSA